jgi:alkyl hydroperoxide reductase subunit AhpF
MPRNLLNDETDKQIKKIFESQLIHHVEIIFFSKRVGCHACEEIQQLLEEITSTSSKLHFSTYDLNEDSQQAQRFHVEVAPALVIAGREGEDVLDFGIRFAGIPSGYEFSSLIHDIIMVSKRDSGLRPEIRQGLNHLSNPVHLKVFVTPT